MILNKNSWHYRLAYFYGPLKWYYHDRTNVCEYASAMMKGLFIVLLALLLGGLFFVAPLADFLAWAYVGVTVGWTEPQFLCIFFLVSLGLGALFLVSIGIVHYVDNGGGKVLDHIFDAVTNSGVYSVVHAWSYKYCFSISFK